MTIPRLTLFAWMLAVSSAMAKNTPSREGREFFETHIRGDGRDHNPYGFTMVMAGGGFRGGVCHGATDEFGFKAVDKRVNIHDLHATLLYVLGLNHEKLTYLMPAATSASRTSVVKSCATSWHHHAGNCVSSGVSAVASMSISCSCV